ncbi:MAG TPA: hypothetical protein VFE59_27230 [Trebonia sp.]|nr:hypothetical protein [Trebonia sp.]
MGDSTRRRARWRRPPGARDRGRARQDRDRQPRRRGARGTAGRGRAAGLGRRPAHRTCRAAAPTAAIWEANAPEIEQWVIRESGKIVPAAQFETHVSLGEIYAATTLPSRPYGDLLPSEQPRLSFAERVPAGGWSA